MWLLPTLAAAASSHENPLLGLPALKKPHYSWPLPYVSSTAFGGAQVDFARITGSFPLGLYSDCPPPGSPAHEDNKTEAMEGINIARLAGAGLVLSWSPWYNCFEAPGGRQSIPGDPRVVGAEEEQYLSEWRARLARYKRWLADSFIVALTCSL